MDTMLHFVIVILSFALGYVFGEQSGFQRYYRYYWKDRIDEADGNW